MQQDGAAPHISKYSQEVFESRNLESFNGRPTLQIRHQLKIWGIFERYDRKEHTKEQTGSHR